jgi:hypothetical protein
MDMRSKVHFPNQIDLIRKRAEGKCKCVQCRKTYALIPDVLLCNTYV